MSLAGGFIGLSRQPKILNDPSTWDQHHELTGPHQLTWPGALQILSDKLGEKVTFRTAGENERTTTTVRDLTGHEPRTVEEFMHENRDSFR